MRKIRGIKIRKDLYKRNHANTDDKEKSIG